MLLGYAARMCAGGGKGIRTLGTVSGSAVFKTAAIDHSATPPGTRRKGISPFAMRKECGLSRPKVPPPNAGRGQAPQRT